MTKFKNVLLGIAGLCLFTALPLAYAQNDQGSDVQWHPGQRIKEIYSQLNLTDTQKQQLQANKEQNRAKMQSARQGIKALKQALREELMQPQLDMAKITSIHDQIKALQSQMEDNKLNSILAVRAILTPEQFLKFVTLMHRHQQ